MKAINLVKRHTKPTKENKGGIISKESFIHYSNVKNLWRLQRGLGFFVLSTPKGVLSDRKARENNVGGEILCKVL